ncbi:MAG: hypothetical protein V7739_06425 [Motiliproteus sp.]
MLRITIQPKPLMVFCLCFLSLVLLSALGLYIFFGRLSAEPLPFMVSVHYSVMFLTYLLSWIVIPLLALRVLYFLVMMIRHGRRQGVGMFSIKFLFNPINLLLFPSLLTDQGRSHRRRCLIAAFLYFFMLMVMLASSRLGVQLENRVKEPTTQSQLKTSYLATVGADQFFVVLFCQLPGFLNQDISGDI